MLRWMCGVTKKDRIRYEHVRGSVKVAPVTKKITEKRLKWYGHVWKREERAKKNVRCASAKEETERNAENLGPKTIKKNTNSTQNNSETHRAKQYEVTSFLSTDCELSTETCSENVCSLGPRWKDSCKRYMESVVLKVEDVLHRTKWKGDNHNHSGDLRRWENPGRNKSLLIIL